MTTEMVYGPDERARLNAYLSAPGRQLGSGLGTAEETCTMGAINLAISGTLTGMTPDPVSRVIGRWIKVVQDGIPDKMRNGEQWKACVPGIPESGREHEEERLQVLLEWMWRTVLPLLVEGAEREGIGEQWRTMCKERSKRSAERAYQAATSLRKITAMVSGLKWVAQNATLAILKTEQQPEDRSGAARNVAWTAGEAARTLKGEATWEVLDPAGVLNKMLEVGRARTEERRK